MRIGIALGSNLGDRVTHLRAAVVAIREFAELPFLVSRVYETEPVDCLPGSPSFLNAALEIGYSGDILALLARLQGIERSQGRPASRGLNAPRTVDLDILYADELTVESPQLILPHPRLMERPFVLLPLSDICPNRKLAGTVRTFSEQVKTLDVSNCNLTDVSIH